MSEGQYIFVIAISILCQFSVGAIVGASIGKDPSLRLHGVFITMALELITFVYGVEVNFLATKPISNDAGLLILRMLGVIIASLTWGLCPLSLCLLISCAGYWCAYDVSRRFGVGPNRIRLAAVFGYVTILAVVTSLMCVPHL